MYRLNVGISVAELFFLFFYISALISGKRTTLQSGNLRKHGDHTREIEIPNNQQGIACTDVVFVST